MAVPPAVLEPASNGAAAVTDRVAAVIASPAAPRGKGSLERRLTLVLGGALAGWSLLAFSFAGRLDLAPVTLMAAAAILALLAATLLYAVRARVDRAARETPA